MDFIKKSYKSIKKTALHWYSPNENPTQFDKYAFNLLQKAEVDLFIQFIQISKVNINVVDFNKISLLMKAQGIPTYNNAHTRTLTQDQLQKRAVKAINYLVKKGVDVNYRGKNGGTALMSACHWGYKQVVEALLIHGADPNLGTEVLGFCTNPLLSSIFKDHKEIATMLILYGADPSITEQYSKKTTGFKLEEKHLKFMYSVYNVYTLTYRRRAQLAKKQNTVLTLCSENMFNEICMMV